MISSWKEERVKIMQLGLEVRFEQNPPLKDLLLNTGNVNLVFNNKKDEFWGIGNGSGKDTNESFTIHFNISDPTIYNSSFLLIE